MNKKTSESAHERILSRKRVLQGSLLLPLSFLLADDIRADEGPQPLFTSSRKLYINRILSHRYPILQALQAGIAAPSPHNVQPWLFEILDENTADLFVDPARRLPHSDPPGRQVMISQGAFLEMMQIGSTMVGLRVTQTLFPRGESEELTIGRRAVARIRAVSDQTVKQDPLADAITKRITDRGVYDNRALSSSAQASFISESKSFHSTLRIIQDSGPMQKIRELAIRGVRIEADNYATNEESRIWFRMSDEEIYGSGDGISLRGNGLSGLRLFVARTFFISSKPDSFHAQSNRDAGVKMLEKAMHSTAACLRLTTSTNTRKDQVLTGKDFVRLQLRCAKDGFHLQPISQVLQEYAEMKGPREEFERISGTTDRGKVQMLLRVGHGKEEFHSPRRDLRQLLRGTKP